MKRFLIVCILIGTVFSSCKEQARIYQSFEGPIFGTSFHIQYEYPQNKNLEKDILNLMNEFDKSLSTYIPNSIISRINSNDPDVIPDSYFRTVFNRSQQISLRTNGAFDLTVAPLVNAYGFGFTKREVFSDDRIKELLSITGFSKVSIQGNKVIKDDPRIMLDASAIAKGYSVDIVCMLLEDQGVVNYLVEIGGEMRCRGNNSKGTAWRVGVDKPVENTLERGIHTILNVSDISMATSGNYRQYYEEDSVKYSHTIDPSTGKPVTHNLLSATVLAPDCMTADAYATAFMVLGLDRSMEIVNSDPDLEGYFIFSEEEINKSKFSEGLKSIIDNTY